MLTGVLSTVVYGPHTSVTAGKHSAGAPFTPENTWFQTPLDQLPMLLLRVKYCCWEPLITGPITESAMKPPLANCGPPVQ